MTMSGVNGDEGTDRKRDSSGEKTNSIVSALPTPSVLPSRRISLIERSRRASMGVGSSINSTTPTTPANNIANNNNNNNNPDPANRNLNGVITGRYGGNHTGKLGMRGNRRISVIPSTSTTTASAITATSSNPSSSSSSSSTKTSSLITPSKRTRVSIGMRSPHPQPPGSLGANHSITVTKPTQQGVGTVTGTSMVVETQEGHRKEGEHEITGKPREGVNRRKSDRVYTYTPANDRRAALDSLKAQQEGKESEMSKMKE